MRSQQLVVPRRRRRFFLHSLGDLRKVTGVAEILVDAGEANVGDVVERFEARHYRFADPRRTDLVAKRLHLPLHAANQPVDARGVDLALPAGVSDRTGELVAVERLSLAVLLDDGQIAQLHALERRKARSACLALAAPADRCAILARPAVLNLAVFVRAEQTAHPLSLIDR